jgi:DNA-directed RNA polymerase subunit RPC12/RpoP
MIKVTAVHRADDRHRVLQIDGVGAHRKAPCNGCPWRLDQTGKFPAEAFRLSADTCYDASFRLFGCHESGPQKPATCAGFLIANSVHNLTARMRGVAGGTGCASPVPLYPSYRAMAIANGVDPQDPAIAPCRADDEPAPRMASWVCRDCTGLFAYPEGVEPNFCPYCKSRRLRPRARPP